MNFYLTLPSTASKDLYPDNKQSSFTVRLPSALKLDGKYEVALTDIAYSSRISINLGKVFIPNPFINNLDYLLGRDVEIAIPLKPGNTTKVSEYFETLNDFILMTITTKEFEFRKRVFYTIKNNPTKLPQDTINHIREEHCNYHHAAKHIYVYQVAIEGVNKDHQYYIFANHNSELGAHLEMIDFKYDYAKQVFVSSKKPEKKEKEEDVNILKVFETYTFLIDKVDAEWFDIDEFYNVNPKAKPKNHTHKEIHDRLAHAMKHDEATYKRHPGVPVFTYIDTKLIITYSDIWHLNRDLRFEGMINKVFDISHVKSGDHYIAYFPSSFNMTRYGFVYVDIIDDQYYGDTMAPILNTIPINPDNFSKSYIDPHYVPVNKSLINSINIRILDPTGEPILFEDIFSFVIVKLHFKRS